MDGTGDRLLGEGVVDPLRTLFVKQLRGGVKEGRFWKRVHVRPRTEFYTPTPEDNGPDVYKLLPYRATHIREEHNMRRIEDDWTTEPQPTRQQEWTGSTTFEERREYREEMPTEEEDEQQSANKAKAMMQPVQPTPQEIQQHNLTHTHAIQELVSCVHTISW